MNENATQSEIPCQSSVTDRKRHRTVFYRTDIIADDVAGLMRAALPHDRVLHEQQLDDPRQLLLDRFLVTLVGKRVGEERLASSSQGQRSPI